MLVNPPHRMDSSLPQCSAEASLNKPETFSCHAFKHILNLNSQFLYNRLQSKVSRAVFVWGRKHCRVKTLYHTTLPNQRCRLLSCHLNPMIRRPTFKWQVCQLMPAGYNRLSGLKPLEAIGSSIFSAESPLERIISECMYY